MIYATPTITETDSKVLAEIEALRTKLRYYLCDPRRWYGTLRRATLARAVQGSNSIEGYHASVADVAAVIEGEEPLEADVETRQAIAGYRDAMTYVLQLATMLPMPPLNDSLVKALHFMMMKHDLSKHSGQWRPGSVWVEDQDGHAVYEAPARRRAGGPRLRGLGIGQRRWGRSHRPSCDGPSQLRPRPPLQRWERADGPMHPIVRAGRRRRPVT